MIEAFNWVDQVYNQDAIEGLKEIQDSSIDLVIADPPYGLGKDFGNNSDMIKQKEFLQWTEDWVNAIFPKLKDTGSFYIFTTWRHSPEIFSFIKTKMTMINEIIWDRKVPSMGGSTRKYSSVHDTIGFFVKSNKYYFDLDSIRIPYDKETKKARSRSIFVGKKWLELGYNPKDLWTIPRLHRIHSEREDHPTQKPLKLIERMVLASSPRDGIVLDPFAGSGTTMAACLLNKRHYLGYEINPDYCAIINERINRIKNGTYNVATLSEKNEHSKKTKNELLVDDNYDYLKDQYHLFNK